MKRYIAQLSCVLSLLCSFSLSTYSQDANLDGNTYLIDLEKSSGKTLGYDQDTLVFASGKLNSATLLVRERFKPVPYGPKPDETGEGIRFYIHAKNPGGSTLKIKGVAKGDSIEGTYMWKSMSGTRNYTFTGNKI